MGWNCHCVVKAFLQILVQNGKKAGGKETVSRERVRETETEKGTCLKSDVEVTNQVNLAADQQGDKPLAKSMKNYLD